MQKNGMVEDRIILPSECDRLYILTLTSAGNIDCNLICIGIAYIGINKTNNICAEKKDVTLSAVKKCMTKINNKASAKAINICLYMFILSASRPETKQATP